MNKSFYNVLHYLFCVGELRKQEMFEMMLNRSVG